jgi:orotate phosphoribosyltransferase-like protein
VFDRARVIELRAAGASWRDIAAELAISVRTATRVYAQGVAKSLSRVTRTRGAMTRVAGA